MPTVIVAACAAFLIVRYGVIGRLQALEEAQDEVFMLRSELSDANAIINGTAGIDDPYSTWANMTEEEANRIERIRVAGILDFIDTEGIAVKSAVLTDARLTVMVTADSLDEISMLTGELNELEIVQSCTITNAQKEEGETFDDFTPSTSGEATIEENETDTLGTGVDEDDDEDEEEEDEEELDEDEEEEEEEDDYDEDEEDYADEDYEDDEWEEDYYEEDLYPGTVNAQINIYLKPLSELSDDALDELSGYGGDEYYDDSEDFYTDDEYVEDEFDESEEELFDEEESDEDESDEEESAPEGEGELL